jgi:hypothetical protein
VRARGSEKEVAETAKEASPVGKMTKISTRILGGAGVAGFATAAVLTLAPAAQADTGALGDGSVRFVAQSIEQASYAALGTRAGGEVVGDV